MPITKSATKALKQNLKKRSRNRHFTALLKESIKNLEINSKKTPIDKDEIKGLLSKVYSCIDKLIKKNIIHKNNGSRKKSKYAKFVKNISLKS